MTTVLLSLLLAGGFVVEPDLPTTMVFPPFGHCMGIYRAGQDQLNMLLGGTISFNDPQGLAAVLLDEWDTPDPGDDDELAVYGVNSGSGHILYNSSMYSLGFYGGRGSGPENLSSPHGIAATTGGKVYVADTGNGRVVILRRSGQRLNPSSFIEGFTEPWDVALDGRYIWVTDRGAGTLSRYASDDDISPQVITVDRPRGVAATGFGQYTSGHPAFQAVITGDGTGLSTVVDGEMTRSVTPADCGGEFFNYVEIDYHGNVWVTDSVSSRIHKFDSGLNWLDSWGRGFGSADDQFENPTGIAIWDRFGQIFIAERAGARYFWVGTDIRGLNLSSSGSGCTVSGILTETATMIVNVYGPDGVIVRSLYTGRRSPGSFSFQWDGKSLQGRNVPGGEYTIRIHLEPVYSSRTYFEKEWTKTFMMEGPSTVETHNSGGRLR